MPRPNATARPIDRRALIVGSAALAVVEHSRAARAQSTWPSRAIKLVVPFTPGGSTDVLARLIGRRLEEALGQPVVIENRPGTGGVPAAASVAKADPDGYTLLAGHIGTLAFNPSLYPNLPYDAATAFTPVARLATVPNILVVHPSVPAATIGDFIGHAKANPGKLNYASGGNGSAAHIATAYLAHATGIALVHVPYRGTGPAVNDLIGGHVQVMLSGGPALLPQIEAGKVRALAVSSRARASFAPSLPTIAESVAAGFEAIQWHGIVGPAGLPAAIAERINRIVNRALVTEEMRETLGKEGAAAAPGTPAEFGRMIAEDIVLWRGVIRRAGISIG